MARPVVVRFLGDAKTFDKVSDGVNKRLGDFGKKAEEEGARAGRGFDKAAEGADNAEGKAQGFASTLTGTKDVMSAAGEIAKGNLFEGFVLAGQGAADLAEGLNYTVIPAVKAAATAFTRSGLATIRDTGAKIGNAVATRTLAVATWAQTVAQRALNLAMRANPIGLVITVIVLLAAAIVTAYKRSETFRNIVQGVWRTVRNAVITAVNFIITAVRGWLNIQIGVVQGILHVMGKLPGPMGAPFRKAEEAVRKARTTINTQMNAIQRKINALRGKNVNVTASTGLVFTKSFTQSDWINARIKAGRMKLRKGGLLPGYGGGDILPILAEPGEAVVDKVRTRKYAHVLAMMGVPGFARGGRIGLPKGIVQTGQAHTGVASIMGDWTGDVMVKGVRAMLASMSSSGNFGSGSWKRAINELVREGVAFRIISTFRRGARTAASGSVSFHALNRAVDLGGNLMRIFNALVDTNPTELIYSAASRYKSRRGWSPISRLDPITRRNHWDHVHAAYRLGTDRVERSGLAMVHEGEKIVPSHRGAGASGVSVFVQSNADPWMIGREVAWAMRTSGR